MDETFFKPYEAQGLKVIALNSDDNDRLDVPGLEEYIDYLDVSYPVGFETSATYEAIAAVYQGSNPYPLDIIIGKDQTIRYIGREYDVDMMESIILEALAE
jgi:hypothetical protein